VILSWIGVNDFGIGYDPKKQVKALFEMQEILYTAGARNFLFLNVHPMDRCPGGNLPITRWSHLHAETQMINLVLGRPGVNRSACEFKPGTTVSPNSPKHLTTNILIPKSKYIISGHYSLAYSMNHGHTTSNL
jgi:hypothetical protein